MADGGVDQAVGAKGVDQTGEEGGEGAGGKFANLQICKFRAKEVGGEEKGPVGAEDGGGEEGQVADGGQGQEGLQGQGDEGVEQVVGVEYQADAQGVKDVGRVEGILPQVEEGVAQPPGVPEEGVFVKGPGVAARHVGGQVAGQGPGQRHGQEGVEGQDQGMGPTASHYCSSGSWNTDVCVRKKVSTARSMFSAA